MSRALQTSTSPRDKAVVSALTATSTGKARVEAAFPHLGVTQLPHHEARNLIALALLQDARLGGTPALHRAAKEVGSIQSAVGAGQRIVTHLLMSAALEGLPHPEPLKETIGRLQLPTISRGFAVVDTRPGVTVAQRIQEARISAQALRDEGRSKQMELKAAAARAQRSMKLEKAKKRLEVQKQKRKR